MEALYNAACEIEHENMQALQALHDAIKVTQQDIKQLQNTSSLLCGEGLIGPHVYANIKTESNKFDAQLQQLINPIPESAVKAVFTSPLKAKRDTPLVQPAKVARPVSPVSPVRKRLMPRRLDFSNHPKKAGVGTHVRVDFVRKDFPAHATPTASDLESWTGKVLEVKKTKTQTHKIRYSDRSVRWEYMPYLKRYNLVTFL